MLATPFSSQERGSGACPGRPGARVRWGGGGESDREARRPLALSLLPPHGPARPSGPPPPALGAASRSYLGPGAQAATPGAAAAAAAGPRGACPSAGGSTRTERGLALPASRSPPLLLWLMLSQPPETGWKRARRNPPLGGLYKDLIHCLPRLITQPASAQQN